MTVDSMNTLPATYRDTIRVLVKYAVVMTVVGLLAGKTLVQYVPQRMFDTLLLTFAAVAGLRMVGTF